MTASERQARDHRIIKMINNGYTQKEIQEALGVTQGVLNHAIYKNKGNKRTNYYRAPRRTRDHLHPCSIRKADWEFCFGQGCRFDLRNHCQAYKAYLRTL